MAKVRKGLVNPVLSTIRQAQPPATRKPILHPYQSYADSIKGMAGRGYDRDSQKLRQLQEDATATAIGGRPLPDHNTRRFYGLFGQQAVNEPQKAMSMVDRQQRKINQSLRVGNANRRVIQKGSYGNGFVGDVGSDVVVQPKKGRPFKGTSSSLTLVSKRNTRSKSVKKANDKPSGKMYEGYMSPYADIYAEQATGKAPKNPQVARNRAEQVKAQARRVWAEPQMSNADVALTMMSFIPPLGVAGKLGSLAARVAPRVAGAIRGAKIFPKVASTVTNPELLENLLIPNKISSSVTNPQLLENLLIPNKISSSVTNPQLLENLLSRSPSLAGKVGARIKPAVQAATNVAGKAGKVAANTAGRAGRAAVNFVGNPVQWPSRAARAFYNYNLSPLAESIDSFRAIKQMPWKGNVIPKVASYIGSGLGAAFGLQQAIDTPIRLVQGTSDFIRGAINEPRSKNRAINPAYATDIPKDYQEPIIINDVRYDASGNELPSFITPSQANRDYERMRDISSRIGKPYLTTKELQSIPGYSPYTTGSNPYTVMENQFQASPANANQFLDYRTGKESPSKQFFDAITFDDLTPEQQAEYILRGRPIEYPVSSDIGQTLAANIPTSIGDVQQLANQAYYPWAQKQSLPIRWLLNYGLDNVANPSMLQMFVGGLFGGENEKNAYKIGLKPYQVEQNIINPLFDNPSSRFLSKEPTYKPATEFSSWIPDNRNRYLNWAKATLDRANEMFSVQTPDSILKDNPMSRVVGFAKRPSREGYYTQETLPSVQSLNKKDQQALEYAKKQLAQDGIPATDEEVLQFLNDLKSLSGFANPLRVATISRVGDKNSTDMVPYRIGQGNAQMYNYDTMSSMAAGAQGKGYVPSKTSLSNMSDVDWFMGSQVPESEYYADFRNQPIPTNWAEAVGVKPEGNQGNLNWWQRLEFGKRATPKKKSSKPTSKASTKVATKASVNKFGTVKKQSAAQPMPVIKKYQAPAPARPSPSVIMKRATPTPSKYDVSARPKNKYS